MDRFSQRYGVTFLLILVTLIVTAAVGDMRIGAFIVPALLGGCLVVTLRASGVRRRTLLVSTALAVLATIAGGVAALVGEGEWVKVLSSVVAVAFVVISPLAIFRDIRRHAEITTRTVMAAICVYLFIGLFFALVYRIVGTIDPPFFVQVEETTVPDTLYFSFITLATVGYGDLTAAGDVTRMLAVTEGLLGQVYLVTIVALLVSNLGRARRRPEE